MAGLSRGRIAIHRRDRHRRSIMFARARARAHRAVTARVIALFAMFREVQAALFHSSVGRRPSTILTAYAMTVVPTTASSSVRVIA
jgi:hypothetical protein